MEKEGIFVFPTRPLSFLQKCHGYKCKLCGESDELKFYKKNIYRCKKCIIKKTREYYKLHLVPTRNEQLCKLRRHGNKSSHTNIALLIHQKCIQAKLNAKRKPVSFQLIEQDIRDLLAQQKNVCALSGMPFNIDDRERCFSIDRIDPSKGYTKENCRLVLSIINYMKKNYSDDKFFKIIKEIHKYQGLSS